MTEAPRVEALIVRAGFFSLYALHRMRELGMRARAVEKVDGVVSERFLRGLA